MKNKYLHITKDNDEIKINAFDGIFGFVATFNDNKAFCAACDNRAKEWLESKLGNYSHLNFQDRKVIADKWLKVKSLKKGKYEYYFNLENLQDVFQKEVKALAKSMGITNYTLILE